MFYLRCCPRFCSAFTSTVAAIGNGCSWLTCQSRKFANSGIKPLRAQQTLRSRATSDLWHGGRALPMAGLASQLHGAGKPLMFTGSMLDMRCLPQVIDVFRQHLPLN